ncbi:MAG: cytochrome c-type biogenesis protein [Gammaproteobacteria bacterium]|nr:cytochrome c-type biogenesis protein [Gammaproteobacteria bacterium]
MSPLKNIIRLSLFVSLVMLAPLSVAKEAAPMAMDPEMEKTVNEISAELRCLVCQNQTIADSHAELAVDLKNQVREMVKRGQTQEEIVDYMVQRYGDFVRYRPPMKPSTVLLWAGPFLLLLIGLTVLVINLRKRTTLVTADGDLSAEESERLKALLASEPEQQAAAQKDKEDKS